MPPKKQTLARAYYSQVVITWLHLVMHLCWNLPGNSHKKGFSRSLMMHSVRLVKPNTDIIIQENLLLVKPDNALIKSTDYNSPNSPNSYKRCNYIIPGIHLSYVFHQTLLIMHPNHASSHFSCITNLKIESTQTFLPLPIPILQIRLQSKRC